MERRSVLLGYTTKQAEITEDASWATETLRDRPFRIEYRIGPVLIDRIGLRPSGCGLLDAVVTSMLAEALISQQEGRGCSISLNKNFYRNLTRYHPALRYRIVRQALQCLHGLGLLELEKGLTWARGGRGKQTSFVATDLLLDLAGDRPSILRRKRHELIVRKDDEKHLVDYRDTEQTSRWRREMAAQNEAIASADIRLSAPDVSWVDDGFVTIPGAIKQGARKGQPIVIRSDSIELYRSFNNNSWRQGGRSYGHWCQSLSGGRRAEITIGGEPVDLLDYGASHIGIIHAQAGVPLESDPYNVDGFDRDEIKKGLLIAINATSERSAVKALGAMYAKEEAPWSTFACDYHLNRAAAVLEAIKDRHHHIAAAFCSGAGVRLQFEEAEVIGDVMKSARKAGVVCLPVHDEIIVSKGRNAAIVQDLMVRHWSERFGTFPVV